PRDGYEYGNDVAIENDGRIVLVGVVADQNGGDFILARFLAGGGLDSSFADHGIQTTDFKSSFDSANGVAIQPDGNIVAVGSATLPPHESDFALARYRPNGTPDASFDSDGKQTTDLGAADVASDVAIDPDGRIVVDGSSTPRFAVARYDADGG